MMKMSRHSPDAEREVVFVLLDARGRSETCGWVGPQGGRCLRHTGSSQVRLARTQEQLGGG